MSKKFPSFQRPYAAVLSGMASFAEAFHPARKLLVGADGIPVEYFLRKQVEHWFKKSG